MIFVLLAVLRIRILIRIHRIHMFLGLLDSVVDPDPEPDPYWIRIQSGLWLRIRIRNPDPDPGGQK
jgi:hypothetical protein